MVMEKLAHSAAVVKVHWLQECHRRKLGQVRRVTVSCPQAAAHAEGFDFWSCRWCAIGWNPTLLANGQAP